MNGKRSGRSPSIFFFGFVLLVFLVPAAFARPDGAPQDSGQEASPSQTQATMASLFGRGAKMPTLPRVEGSLALPSFDKSGLEIDVAALEAAQKQGHETSGKR